MLFFENESRKLQLGDKFYKFVGFVGHVLVGIVFVELLVIFFCYGYRIVSLQSYSEYQAGIVVQKNAISKCQKEKNLPIGQMTGTCYKLMMSNNL